MRKNLIFPLLLSALAGVAQAATITVNDATDGSVPDACTLRDSIDSVNTSTAINGCAAGDGNRDTIEFDSRLNGASISVVNGGQIEIRKNLAINAPAGGITLNGKRANRIFYVPNDKDSQLAITGVTFLNGNVGYANQHFGGAIDANKTLLSLRQCTFEDNQAGYGGAVNAGVAILSNSTFRRNSVVQGGGAVNAGRIYISNSTFTDNRAGVGNKAGGGGGAVYASSIYISNSTFINNSITGGVEGNAVYALKSLIATHLTLLNNTVDNNIPAMYIGGAITPPDVAALHNSIIIGGGNSAQCAGVIAFTGSHNLEGWADKEGNWQGATAATCGSDNTVSDGGVAALDDIIATALADNGGPTQTLKLPTGSPAIGKADPAAGNTSLMLEIDFTASPLTVRWADATHDQRGHARSADAGRRNIGAHDDTQDSTQQGGTQQGGTQQGGTQQGGTQQGGTQQGGVQQGGVQQGGVQQDGVQQDGTQQGTTQQGTTQQGTTQQGTTQQGTTQQGTTQQDSTQQGGVQQDGTQQGGIQQGGIQQGAHAQEDERALPTGSTPIPVLPVPLLLGLAAAVGLLGRRRLTRGN